MATITSKKWKGNGYGPLKCHGGELRQRFIISRPDLAGGRFVLPYEDREEQRTYTLMLNREEARALLDNLQKVLG
jgi:hypothetical protein